MDESVWEQVKQQCPLGTVVTGEVTEVRPYGVFVDLREGLVGLLLVPDAGLERGQQTADHFQIGQSVTAKVIVHHDERQIFRLTRQV